MSMIAGSATPIEARMMWNPSVKAIWLRAHSRFDVRSGIVGRAPSGTDGGDGGRVGRVLVPVDPGGARAVEDLRSPVAGERLRRPFDEGVDARVDARHQRGVDAEPGGVGDRAVQLV